MVAEVHPITHPAKTKRRACKWLLPATATRTQMIAQTIPQPMLYAV
jgi:hypothetical protein